MSAEQKLRKNHSLAVLKEVLEPIKLKETVIQFLMCNEEGLQQDYFMKKGSWGKYCADSKTLGVVKVIGQQGVVRLVQLGTSMPLPKSCKRLLIVIPVATVEPRDAQKRLRRKRRSGAK